MGVLATLAVLIGDLAVIGGALVWGWRKTKGLRVMAEDWQGEPERRGPGGALIAPARPSAMERIAVLEVDLSKVHKELTQDSGSSARDAIDRLEVMLRDLQREVRQQRPAAAERPAIEASGMGFQAERAEI